MHRYTWQAIGIVEKARMLRLSIGAQGVDFVPPDGGREPRLRGRQVRSRTVVDDIDLDEDILVKRVGAPVREELMGDEIALAEDLPRVRQAVAVGVPGRLDSATIDGPGPAACRRAGAEGGLERVTQAVIVGVA